MLFRYKSDLINQLLQTRVEIEHNLRIILGKTIKARFEVKKKFISLNRLINMFIEQYPDYKYLKPSFDFVKQACNYAVHAQPISSERAREVVDIGAKLIAILQNVAKQMGLENYPYRF